jgi:putative LysE/RhtB family amino acid efflux pump
LLEELSLLLWGVVLGLAIAAPVGPTGLLCIRRTVERGLPMGLATGLGAAIADAGFSSIAAFGINAVLDVIVGHKQLLQIVGGLFLLGAAVHSFMKPPSAVGNAADTGNLGGAVLSGLLLTATNPVTIIGMTTLVVSLGGVSDTAGAATLVGGIFIGSALWWMTLCGGVALVRDRLSETAVLRLNRGTGLLLAVLGLWAIGNVVVSLA